MRQHEGCVCGHGPYNHGGGYTAIGKLLGEHSRCIRCSCMEFRRDLGTTTSDTPVNAAESGRSGGSDV